MDYLLIGKNSGGYEFVFVELEGVVEKITTADGDFGATIRKGLLQVEDWDSWLESNFIHLRNAFDKALGEDKLLPKEFYELDKSRLHYVVVAGRRQHYKEKTYRKRRKIMKEKYIEILHYDNLVDGIISLSEVKNYC